MTHYGIRVTESGGWMTDDSGIVFWTTSEAVAVAQLRKSLSGFGGPGALEVRAFEEATPYVSSTRVAAARAFSHRGLDLSYALDALRAYDGGATDRGIEDVEGLRAAVVTYCNGLAPDERRRALAEVARHYLTDRAIDSGYGPADVLALARWLEGQGVPVAG